MYLFSRIRDYFFPSKSQADLMEGLNVVADIAVSPVGVGASISPYIKTCGEILKSHHLKVVTHAFGTNVEGKWADIQEALRDCHRTLHQQQVPRVSSTITFSTRTDKEQSLASRMTS